MFLQGEIITCEAGESKCEQTEMLFFEGGNLDLYTLT